MQDLTEQVIRGSFWGTFSGFLSRIGTFILTLLLARFLFPENFGLYSLTMSIAFIFMAFADLGLNQMLIRYFSFNIKNKERAASHFQYILKLKFVVSLTVSFLLLFLSYPIAFWIYRKPSLFLPLVMASFFIMTFLFIDFFSALFYSIKKVHYVGIKELFFQIIRIAMVVLVFFFIASAYRLLGIFTGLILTNLIIILILIIWINKFLPYLFKKSNVKIDKKRLIRYFKFVIIASISGMLFTSTDVIMLGFFVSLAYVGFYKIASTLIFGIISLFTHLGLVLLPIFTNLRKKRLEIAFNKALRFVLIFSIPAMFGILALGKYLIKILYGDNYLEASSPLIILSFLLLIWVFVSLVSVLFLSKEQPKYIAKAQFMVFFLNIILNYIFIFNLVKISELWAINGAAIATIISFFVYFVCVFFILRKKLKIQVDKMIFIKPIFAGIIMFLFLYAINSYAIKNVNLFTGILEIFLGIFIYFFIMIMIKGFVKEDINILKKIPFPKLKNQP